MKRSMVSAPAALSPQARELLELGSFVAPPTAEQDERMDRALARLIALDRAAATRLGQSGSPRAPKWRLNRALASSSAGKLWLALGALAATAGASFWMGRASLPDDTEPTSTTAALELPAIAAPSDLPPQLPVQAAEAARVEATSAAPAPSEPSLLALEVPTTTSDDALPLARPQTALAIGVQHPPDPGAAPAPRAKRTSSTEPSPLGLSAEIQRLARAEAALRQGRPQQALVELEPPAAHLLEQAAALWAIAECTLDRAPSAPRARETLQRWPASAFAPRIREACGL